tara:strand:- start:1025 stop:1804 length:780 start_codon:yes stop_codon:yes gene_type:complete
MKTKVSIIMNCYNGSRYLKKSITSVINQNYKHWELIFFDNLSTDNSIKIAKSFKDERIKIFKTNKFLKLYEARNQAIKKTKGQYICFCDTDDWWFKSKLQVQIDFLNKNKEVNLLFTNLFVLNEKTKTKKLYFGNNMPSGMITQHLLDDYKLGILTVLVNKKFFNRKKFNKKYNIIGDFDFFINLSLKEKFYCLHKPLAVYRLHDKNFSKKTDIYAKEMAFWLKENSYKFKKLNYSLNLIRLTLFKLKFKTFFNIFRRF